MKVTLLLCDFAQVAEGKISLLGGGWTFKGQGTPMALAAVVEVPWSDTNERHEWSIALLDTDGHAVEANGADDKPVPIRTGGTFEVGRPPGHPIGTPQNVPIALNLGPLLLPPGQRFTFVFELDSLTSEEWQVSFNTQSPTT